MGRKKKKKSTPNNYSSTPKIPKFQYEKKEEVSDVEDDTYTAEDVIQDETAPTNQELTSNEITFRESIFDDIEVNETSHESKTTEEKIYEPMERKVVLITFWEGHSRQHRNNDLMACLKDNISNPVFDKVVVFELNQLPKELENQKVSKVQHSGKLRFSHIFKYVKENWQPDTIYVVANHNISFDYKISRIHYIKFKNKCVVLSRWNRPNCQFFTDWAENNTYTLQWDNWENHDVWIFQDDLKDALIDDCEPRFIVNKASAKIAHLFEKHGYILKNYSYDITAFRNYPCEDANENLNKTFDYPSPYGIVLPSHLKSEEA